MMLAKNTVHIMQLDCFVQVVLDRLHSTDLHSNEIMFIYLATLLTILFFKKREQPNGK